MTTSELTTHQKALAINMEPAIYGAFAEIGAGQEIARWFFRVGGAAGTVAKTMSAYDMKVSDAIYGKASRYVSRDRVQAMLEHEFSLLIERLGPTRGPESTFFAFADSVAARSYGKSNVCHGWMGIRFQTAPGKAPNDVMMHVNMLDRENIQQQEALGILGINLLYAAYYMRDNMDTFIENLLDDLSVERLEIDLLELSGPDFSSVDQRMVGLKLIQLGLTNAIVFDPSGALLQPSEVLYKRPVMIERGAFRAMHEINAEPIKALHNKFAKDVTVAENEPISLIEISVTQMTKTEGLIDGHAPESEVLETVEKLRTMGYQVMVSNFREFFPMTAYIRRYTPYPLAFVMGVSTLVRIFHERYYKGLEGGVLEAIGRLFTAGVMLYVYPLNLSDYQDRMKEAGIAPTTWCRPGAAVASLETLEPPPPLLHLYRYLLESGYLKPV